MNKSKWHNKLVNLAVAFALVFSLGIVAALPVSEPVMASPGAAALTVNITAPAENITFSVCENFDLKFTIKNTGNVTAEMVNATVFPSSKVNVDGLAAGQSYTVATIASLAPNATSPVYTVKMHCAGADEPGYLSSIHVMPAGEEEGEELPSASLKSMIVHFHQVFGVTCKVDPNPTKHCHNVTFTATVGDGAVYNVTWEWDFDDGSPLESGTIGESENPFSVKHHYSNNTTGSKVFHACITVTDDSDITAECCKDVVVYPKLAVSCNATPNPTKEGHEVEFTADAVGGIPEGESDCVYSWSWDFGDGVGTSTDQKPTYTYDTAGNYTAIVTLDDGPELGNTANCSVEIRVYPGLNVTCDAEPEIIKIPHCVNFTAEAVGGVPGNSLSWSWNITNEDTSVVVHTADTQNVTCWHPSIAGNYSGTVTVTDEKLGNSANCSTNVRVYGGVNVTCDAEPDPAHVCNEVNFTAEVTGGWPEASYNWTWVFKNEDTSEVVGTSEEQNPSFTFMCVGNYSGFVEVCDNLTPTNCGNCTANVTVIIEPPELIDPELNETVLNRWVSFEWEDIGCCNYTLQVWQKDGAGDKVLLVETGKDNTWSGWIMDNDKYKWQVTATDSCGINATSDLSYFEVQDATLNVAVTRPAEDASWAGGSTQTIMWTTNRVDSTASGFGAVGDEVITVDLSYSSDGATWTPIATGQPEDGVFSWSVPEINSNNCLIKAEASDGYGNYGVGYSGVFTITSAPPVVTSYDIPLAAGWNLMSPPLIPDDSDIDVVISAANLASGNVGNVALVYYYDAGDYYGLGVDWRYWSGPGTGDLPTIEDGLGYWFFMNSADTLTIHGTVMPSGLTLPPTYDVVSGWNMIGFKSTANMANETYLISIVGKYMVLYGFDADAAEYFTVYPLGQHGGKMEPGHGYWIWMDSAGTIVPP